MGLAASVLLSSGLSAQVTFTNQSNLLNPADFPYEDCAVDMNGDYLDDVVRVTSNGIYIDYQQTDGTFDQTFFPMSVDNPPSWSICAGDIDGNGYNDLLFGNGTAVSFCMANSDGTGYTEDPRPEYIFSQRSTMADIDNDGNLDAFVCHDVDQSHPYRNDGTGYLVLDQTLINTLDVGGNYAAIWCDYDNDWDIDLYITKCRGGAAVGDPQRINLLYRNNGDGTFTEVGEETNMNDGDQSWTTVFEDFDNDGDFDAFTVNHSWANRLMENNGDGTFTDIIDGSGIDITDLGAWNCDAGDFDNNGFVDIFSEMDDELYLNNGDGTFTPQNLDFDSGGIADFNNDGFLDVVSGNSLWINGGNDNNYVMFTFEGVVSNKNGIGARIEIYGDWGVQVREVRSGESFSPMSSLGAHFGLGDATSIDQVIVKWPSGMVTELTNPDINTTHHMYEAGCILDPNEIAVNGSTNICPGETITLSAEEGFESYSWSTGDDTQTIEVSEPGTYSVLLWEGECVSVSNSVQITVIEEEYPEIAVLGEEVFCEGGEVVLEASEGEGYMWSTNEETQSIVVSEAGTYHVAIDALCSDDVLVSEDIVIDVLPGAATPVAEDVEIPEQGYATLTATGDNLKWYDDEFATTPVGEGESITTTWVTDQLIYWVEANAIHGGGEETGGKADNSGGGGLPSVGAYSMFNAYEPFTIKTVRVYVPEDAGDGSRTVQLADNVGVILASATFDLEIGEHVIELNFDVPMGSGFSLRCPENDLFRNNSGVNYPYEIGTVGAIYDSYYGGSYYYYFYDWTIEKASVMCPSERVSVMAYTTGIEEIEGLNAFGVYPNPNNGDFNVEISVAQTSDVLLKVRDAQGRVVAEQTLNGIQGKQVMPFNMPNLASGVYAVELQLNGQKTQQRLVIQ